MSRFDFVIKKGDLLPIITATLKDANNDPVDLTGTSVKFIMRLVGATTPKVNAAGVVDSNQVTNKGKVSYPWIAADTNAGGVYEAEWQVTFSGAKPETFPNDGYLVIKVMDELGS
jgi:hypothetical protein